MDSRASRAPGGRPFGPGVQGSRVRIAGTSESLPRVLVYVFWVLMTFEPDLLLTSITGIPFFRVPIIFLPVLGLFILLRGDRKVVYWPLILFVLMHLGASLLAENAGLSRDAFKFTAYMLVLFVSSASFVDSPGRAVVLLKLYLLSFAWFGIQGMPASLGGLHRGAGLSGVGWHPSLANEDSFGPLMVISMAFSYFFALATLSPRWRRFARGVFVVSIVGVVVTFARGAQLSGAAVLVYILWHSPRRVAAFACCAIIAIVLLPVAAMFFPLDAYIAEMSTVSKGDDLRTGLWQLAWNVFQESPVYGVGAMNFGVVASRITPYDPNNPLGADPSKLYLFWIHNVPMQIIAEEGLIGITLWITMIVGFLRANRRLRAENAVARWRERAAGDAGGDFDVRIMARGLDGAMLGYLATSLFYNQLYFNHWFWSLLTLSYVLRGLTAPTPHTRREADARP